ncbi:mitochondrial outer membrane translocase complex, subunit Tom5 [Xylariomycetidae sp. FL0641]|nr:mitochondrial outer membrane translocase complex, subunit Tom5 [Xylariomycetidae sp. FL0641]
MFGFQQPQLSKQELEMLEAEADSTISRFFTTAVILYISPFVVEAVSGIF